MAAGNSSVELSVRCPVLRLCDAMWNHSEQHGSKFLEGVVETLCYDESDSGRDSNAR